MRPASALPFGGKYRVIDFTLSNCVHSGLTRIGILTQYAPLSLQQHIGIGRAWDLDRRDGGVRLLQPYVRQRETNWYRGTADALVQNRNVIADAQARHILVASGDLVYKMDYGRLIERHESRGSILTVVTAPCPDDEPERYGPIEVDASGRVIRFEDRTAAGTGTTVSASVYLFRGRELLTKLQDRSLGPDLVRDVIRPMVRDGLAVHTYPLDGYWRDVSTLEAYYAAHMDLLRERPPLNLNDPDWLIYTPSEDRAPALCSNGGDIVSSMVSHGARIEGTVRHSVIFPGVHIGPNATVEDSIVMHDARVLPGATLHGAIVDKQVRIGENVVIGVGEPVPHREHPHDLSNGLSVLGKGAEVPAGTRIGRNTLIETRVHETDFVGDVPSGSTVRARMRGRVR
jgi:glucose-1-phosphate adenylyltransferase